MPNYGIGEPSLAAGHERIECNPVTRFNKKKLRTDALPARHQRTDST